MIIKNKPIINKSVKIISALISLCTVFICICIILYYELFYSNVKFTALRLIYIIITAIPILDIISLYKRNKAISLYIVKKLYKDKFFSFSNDKQCYFIESILGKNYDNNCIVLWGNKGTGKTSAVFHLLDSLSSSLANMQEALKASKIIFVNCLTNREEIINFFSFANKINYRIDKFKESIVVIDNIEKMGSYFIEANESLFKSKESLFILILDTKDAKLNLPFNNKNSNFNFTSEIKILNDNIYTSFHGNERDIFVIFNTISEISDIVHIHTLFDLVEGIYTKRQVKKAIKQLIHDKYIIRLPFNKEYFCKLKNVKVTDFPLDANLSQILNNSKIEDIHKWFCLIKCSKQTIESNLDQKDRIKLFNLAVKLGNYEAMYDFLNSIKDTNKKELFLYERALLAFHVGKHKESSELYDNLLNQSIDSDERNFLMIGYIEATHGSNDKIIKCKINTYLKELKNSTKYSIYSEYWKTHIDTEKGIFNINKFNEIRNKLYSFKDNSILRQETIQRCFTDYIRGCHILNNTIPNNIIDEFENFLKGISTVKYEYYYNLYVKANTLHYMNICDMFIENNTTEIKHSILKALEHYEKALKSGYGDQKSTIAAKVKNCELQLLYSDFNVEEIKGVIQDFRIQAAVNKVDVHIAYADTMLMKLYMVNPEIYSNIREFKISEETQKTIEKLYKNVYHIYSQYENEYGIFRLKFLKLLFNYYLYTTAENLEKIGALINSFQLFKREYKIYDELSKRFNNNKESAQYIFNIIKAYPIILQ